MPCRAGASPQVYAPRRPAPRHIAHRFSAPPRPRPRLLLLALPPDAAQTLYELAVGVGLPCTVMNCGDVVYRSTLDPKLRFEEARGFARLSTRLSMPRTASVLCRTKRRASLAELQSPLITEGGAAILLLLVAYLSATPGAAWGFLDYFILAPLAAARSPRYTLDNFVLEKKLGEGGFGAVWLATLLPGRFSGEPAVPVVLKQAREFGAAEAWMNGRARRACPGVCASFIASFRDSREPALSFAAQRAARSLAPEGLRLPDWDDVVAGGWMPKWPGRGGGQAAAGADADADEDTAGRQEGDTLYDTRPRPGSSGGSSPEPEAPLWLVWQLEGTRSFASFLEDPDFPYNLEVPLLGRESVLPRGHARAAPIVKALTLQVLTGLARLHATGIVHRDVKPENYILAGVADPGRARLVLVDLGAAADLRTGINYVPREYLLDPRYAAPEQYIMSTQTPSAPPVAVALLLSPALWQLNLPDRFDCYAAGLVLLQCALPSLRKPREMSQLRRALASQLGEDQHSLEVWREGYTRKPKAAVFGGGGAAGDAADADGWALLDADGGAGWELVRKLCCVRAEARLSAGAASRHRFLAPPSVAPLMRRAEAAIAALGSPGGAALGREGGWILRRLVRSGSLKEGGFTEGQLEEYTKLSEKLEREAAAAVKQRRGRGGGGGSKEALASASAKERRRDGGAAEPKPALSGVAKQRAEQAVRVLRKVADQAVTMVGGGGGEGGSRGSGARGGSGAPRRPQPPRRPPAAEDAPPAAKPAKLSWLQRLNSWRVE